MTDSNPDGWHFVHIGFEGPAVYIGGVDVWGVRWSSTGDRIEVPHPSYPSQRHTLSVWNIETDHGPVKFAAGELSNGVWCFYEPDVAP